MRVHGICHDGESGSCAIAAVKRRGRAGALASCALHGFRGRGAHPNLTVKKIPRQVLSRCEWGHDYYSFQVENLPQKPSEPGQQDLDLGAAGP